MARKSKIEQLSVVADPLNLNLKPAKPKGVGAMRGVNGPAAQSGNGLRYKVEPHLPPDVLCIYVYLPVI